MHCTIIERRWNRNEVSRGYPDTELNRRPSLLYYDHIIIIIIIIIGRSSRGGIQKLILEIITPVVNHPSGSHAAG